MPDEKPRRSPLSKKRVGRPLSFDRDAALRKAMAIFWKYGYEPTSISDLTAALNITPPSLYAAFGNKESIFLEAVELYSIDARRITREIYGEASTAKEAIHNFLLTAAKHYTNPDCPGGCLVLTAATNYSSNSGHIADVLRAEREAAELRMRKRIAEDKKSGALPPSANPKELAAFYYAVLRGMSSMARDGATKSKLLGVIETAMKVWP